MIKKQQYITLVIAMNKLADIGTASEIAQMHRNTGSKYLKSGKFPGETGKRKPGFIRPSSIQDGDWEEVKKRLEDFPELEATAVLENLMERHEGRYTGKELRSLQRKICDWKALHGHEKEVIFWQTYSPGERSQSDFIHMDYLNIMIQGKQFDHLIFHFTLPYSGWENVMVCEGGESFENLCAGYEGSVWKLRGVPKIHRTDNLSAAITASTRNFTDSWGKLMSHYNTQPTVNNPGKSNENGKVERSNGLIKRSLANQLCFRGSKDFKSITDYAAFIDRIVDKRNKYREIKVNEEREELQPLPDAKWYAASQIPVRVNTDSTIRVGGASYSVPSRTIGHILSAYIYPNKIEVYYGNHLLQTMPKFQKGEAHINFVHVISSLRKKPGAFEDYRYKEYMYPTTAFRQTYDKLKKRYRVASKHYIEVLYLASVYGVEEVSSVLTVLLKAGILPLAEDVKKRLAHHVAVPDVYIRESSLKEYDKLTGYSHAN
jgi:hypothetical protein